MTPQERALVDDLFDRLARLEGGPRDAEAEQAIRAGLAKAPNALYALVQSVLVQDEALKRADARIRELEGGGEDAPDDGRPRGFLDTMRDALLGGSPERRGSVPTVRPGEQSLGAPPQYRPGYGTPMGGPSAAAPMGGPAPNAPPSYGAPPAYGAPPSYGQGGGSFLGTAAAAAAGMIGGSLLLGGIRNMLGGGTNQGPFAGTFNQTADTPTNATSSPWGDASNSDLARQAGINNIGGAGQRAGNDDTGGRQGLFDTAGNNAGYNDASFDDDVGGFDGGGDTA